MQQLNRKQHINAPIDPSFYEKDVFMMEENQLVRHPFYDIGRLYKLKDAEAEEAMIQI